MKTVANIMRVHAKEWRAEFNGVWISIGEPEECHIQNKILDARPNLKLKFWDVVKPIPLIGSKKYEKYGEYAMPPTEEDAKKIVDFLLEHKDKAVVVNCRAGVSRSGAVAQFCEEFLEYHWLPEFKENAMPNTLLYSMMKDYFLSFNAKPIKFVDKRRKYV
jgi:predicted protein tyrosine phosphatase